MTTFPLPRRFSRGFCHSFSPIFARDSLPALLSFIQDVGCTPTLKLSLDGNLYLEQKDGRFILCPDSLLEWVEHLQPNGYPVPQLAYQTYTDQTAQTETETPPLLSPQPTRTVNEQLLEIRDLTKFTQEVYLGAGYARPKLEVKDLGGRKMARVKVAEEVMAECVAKEAQEVTVRALLDAVRRVDSGLAERWQKRYLRGQISPL